jgi:hypothetical protein
LLTAGVAARRIWRFQGLLRLAEPASEETKARVEALAGRLGLGNAPGVWAVPGAVSPMLWSLGCRPRLIVPTDLWDRLDEPQRDTLLTHELAHLKRRDHWVRCLELLVTGLYWWLPLVWIARHALREAEEQCCDAWVVWAFPDASRTYAEALLETVDFLSGVEPAVPMAASGLGQVGHLKRRMTMIMQGTTPRAMTWSGLLAVLGLSATLLPLSPIWAQRPDDSSGETPAFAPDKPKARNPGDRPEGDPTRPSAETPKPRARGFQFKGQEALDDRTLDKLDQAMRSVKEAMIESVDPVGLNEAEKQVMRSVKEAMLSARARDSELHREVEKAQAELREKLEEITARKPGEPLDGPSREQLERAIQRFRDVATAFRKAGPTGLKPKGEQERAQAEQEEGKEERVEKSRQEMSKRGLSPAPRPVTPEAGRDDRESAERRAEVARLKAEVEERRAALVEAQVRLNRAIKQLAEAGQAAGVDSRTRTFEIWVNKTGKDPFIPAAVRVVPRPDQEKRMAELEERLEKLQDEVKSLKQEVPSRR